MQRREFLATLGRLSAGASALALLPAGFSCLRAQALHEHAAQPGALRTLSAAQHALLARMADLLLPATDSVGALDVGVDRFIDLLLSEAMLESARTRFLDGLEALEARSRSAHGAPFVALSAAEQAGFIAALDVHWPPANLTHAEQEAQARAPMTAERGFEQLKYLVVFGYFTSEPVMKDLLDDPLIPGRYDGCVPV